MMDTTSAALITSDAVVLGILVLCLGFVFQTSHSARPGWRKFYSIAPPLLLCYLLPSICNSIGLIDGENSKIYYVTSRFLLPSALVLLTLNIDLKKIIVLGPKAGIMFLTGTVGVIIGGPLAILIVSTFSPDTVAGDEIWRGLTTVAGSWIGGGANQAAMFEMFEADSNLFGAMIAVDVIVANIWMACLLYMASRAKELDAKRGADVSAINDVRETVEHFEKTHARIMQLPDLIKILAIGLGATGLAHFLADNIAPWINTHAPELKKFSLDSHFFWLVVIATTVGLLLSFTPAHKIEGVGASKIGAGFIYLLVASIGMKMDITAVVEYWDLFIVGLIWMAIHVALMFIVARLIKAPTFFLAVGSKANIGGAASAPVVAAAFHPSLAPVGVLLAVFGYALGTYGAWLCGIMMQWLAVG